MSTGPVPEGDPAGGTVAAAGRRLADYPAVARLAGQLAQNSADEDFQAALTALLDRMEHLNGLPSPTARG